MKRDEIMAMQPGRELDALVAEKVMGWTVTPYNPDYHIQYTDEHGNPFVLQMSDFAPSTDISAAMEAEDKMFENDALKDAYLLNLQNALGIDDWNTTREAVEKMVHAAAADRSKAALLAVMEVNQ